MPISKGILVVNPPSTVARNPENWAVEAFASRCVSPVRRHRFTARASRYRTGNASRSGRCNRVEARGNGWLAANISVERGIPVVAGNAATVKFAAATLKLGDYAVPDPKRLWARLSKNVVQIWLVDVIIIKPQRAFEVC